MDYKEEWNKSLDRGGADAITGFKDPNKILNISKDEEVNLSIPSSEIPCRECEDDKDKFLFEQFKNIIPIKTPLEGERFRPPWNKGIKTGISSENQRRIISERMSGDNHPLCKITQDKLEEIINKFLNGNSRKQLSEEYNVNYAHLCKLIKDKIKSYEFDRSCSV